MVAKDYQKIKGSGKSEVGEIDTSAPFQSVKAAVSLFGESAFSGEKPAIRKQKPQSAERVLAKETELHLAQKELNKFNKQLENAETTKSQALSELEKAKRTVEDLTQKLKIINESKDSAIKATEAAKHQAKQFSDNESLLDFETSRVQYAAAVAELDLAKQELRRIRLEYDASIEEKDSAAKRAAEAESADVANTARAAELSKEIASVHNSIQQAKLEIVQAKEEETRVCSEKDKQKLLCKAKLEELAKKLVDFKKGMDPEGIKNLEGQLGETLSEIEALRNQMENTRVSDLDSVKAVTTDLNGAKESLNKVAEEESSLRNLVETLKLELDEIKKSHSELKDKEAETESLAGNLNAKLLKAKSELEAALSEEAKIRGASDEMIASIRQLVSESENVKNEANEMKLKAEELKREAETTRNQLEEAEKKLIVAQNEAEEAKAAELRALDRIKILSEKTDAARASTSEHGAHITISRDEYDSVSRKVEESEKLADMKVAAAVAQVEAVRAGENEALKKLDSLQKEIEDLKAATREAVRKAEMAEAAKKAVEGELRRWRERELKKAEEVAAAAVLAEREEEEKEKKKKLLYETNLGNYQIATTKQKVVVETRKLEKAKTSISKKVMMPSLSGVFHRKKNKVEGGSPSYLPGEKPVW
ncbi:hypothetical protein ABFX02_13G156100 [Erythranthe guttata]